MRNVALIVLGILLGIAGTLGFQYVSPLNVVRSRQGAVCTIQVRSENFRVNPRIVDSPTDAVYGAFQEMDREWIVIAPLKDRRERALDSPARSHRD